MALRSPQACKPVNTKDSSDGLTSSSEGRPCGLQPKLLVEQGGGRVVAETEKGKERALGSGPVARGAWVESCSAEFLRRFLLEQPRGEGAAAVHSASLSCLRKSSHDAFGFTQPTTW